jgi:hypothetical protein
VRRTVAVVHALSVGTELPQVDLSERDRERVAALLVALSRLSMDADFAVRTEGLADVVWPPAVRDAEWFPGRHAGVERDSSSAVRAAR